MSRLTRPGLTETQDWVAAVVVGFAVGFVAGSVVGLLLTLVIL